MKTFDAMITATITMSVQAESKASAIAKVKKTVPTGVFSKSGRMLYAISIDEIHLTETRIMDGSTSHDKTLIESVNRCYAHRNELFYEIIRLLADRDIDEFDESIDTNTASMKDIAYHYLHAIADDEDLRTIIYYCRL